MRLSRSKITIGADTAQLLAAQQIAQNPSLANKRVKSPELPSSPPVGDAAPRNQKISASPVAESEGAAVPPPPPALGMKNPPPPPPSVAKPVPPPPPVHPVVGSVPPPPPFIKDNNGSSIRPNFKDPLPELDDLPPMPAFKDPPPEVDDFPPRPIFADPPREDDTPTVSTSPQVPPPPSTNIIPPTPQKHINRGKESPRKIASRSPSPPTNAGSEDMVLGTGRSTISRASSSQATGAMRGPRMVVRSGRPLSGNVQNMVQSLNRNTNTSPVPTSPKPNRFSGSGNSASPVRRPSSIVGRNATTFSRRTMASDAEDDLVDRK